MKEKQKIVEQDMAAKKAAHCQEENVSAQSQSLAEKIDYVLHKMNMQKQAPGERYLKDAIQLWSKDADVAEGMLQIYNRLAGQYHIKPRDIERAIRFAIQRSWCGRSREEFESLTGDFIPSMPTNRQFVEGIAYYLQDDKIKG